MVPVLLLPHMEAIARLCQRCGVATLGQFGSAATGDFKPGVSDYNFLYEMDLTNEGSLAKRFFEFAETMEALLGTHVDLVNSHYIRNPYFKAEVDRTRIPVYRARPNDACASDLSPAWAEEIARRLTAHDGGEAQAIDAAEVFAKARSLAQ